MARARKKKYELDRVSARVAIPPVAVTGEWVAAKKPAPSGGHHNKVVIAKAEAKGSAVVNQVMYVNFSD